MAATTVVTTPSVKSQHHRGLFAAVAGVVIAGALATSAFVIADDSDSAKPASTTPPASTEIEVNDDPLMERYGTPEHHVDVREELRPQMWDAGL